MRIERLFDKLSAIEDIHALLVGRRMKGEGGRMDAAAEEGDISGDYNEYGCIWSQEVDGINVKCMGNRDGESTKTIWQKDDYLYSINGIGTGGDADFGLSTGDLQLLISAINDASAK